MIKRFDEDYYVGLREDLVEDTAKEYIKDGVLPIEAWEKAEEDVSSTYDLWQDDMQEYADIQRELSRDRALGL